MISRIAASALAHHLAVSLLVIFASIVALAISGCASNHVPLSGTVVDAVTGQPVAGARIETTLEAKPVLLQADDEGRYRVDRAEPDAKVTVRADRYHDAQFSIGKGGEVRSELSPVSLQGTVTDSLSAKPIAGVAVSQGANRIVGDGSGRYQLHGFAPGQTVRWQAHGYEAKEQVVAADGQFDLQLRPNALSGRVLDGTTSKPIAGASVSAGSQTVVSNSEGRFNLVDLPARTTVTAKAAGYDAGKAEVEGATSLDLTLKPFTVRAAYLTYYGVAADGLRDNVIKLIEETELNAVVIDIKGDFGRLTYKSAVPLAQTIGANAEPTVSDIEALLRDLKRRGIYTIARFVIFKDDVLGRNGGKAGLDVAVQNGTTGGPWIDGEGLVWVDPFRTEVWDYNTALAVEAAKKGFDEIQFDYIRFPTDPSPGSSVNAAVFSRPSNEANRTGAIEGFLSKAREALRPTGASLSVDVFGYTCWRDDDMGIGQNIEAIGKHVDFIAPMVYPSTYSDGLPMTPDYKDATAYPYEIVHYSVKRAVERLEGMAVKVRPWLQYFDDYPWATGREYNAAEVEAQIRAGQEAGGVGYMLWDPTNRFSRGGLDVE